MTFPRLFAIWCCTTVSGISMESAYAAPTDSETFPSASFYLGLAGLVANMSALGAVAALRNQPAGRTVTSTLTAVSGAFALMIPFGAAGVFLSQPIWGAGRDNLLVGLLVGAAMGLIAGAIGGALLGNWSSRAMNDPLVPAAAAATFNSIMIFVPYFSQW